MKRKKKMTTKGHSLIGWLILRVVGDTTVVVWEDQRGSATAIERDSSDDSEADDIEPQEMDYESTKQTKQVHSSSCFLHVFSACVVYTGIFYIPNINILKPLRLSLTEFIRKYLNIDSIPL